jgi:ornithine carbamoyltransferase
MTALKGRDFLTIADFNQDELYHLLARSIEFKKKKGLKKVEKLLDGRCIALIFYKPSSRTRVSFEVAAAHLGAQTIFLRDDEIQLGKREPIEDIGRVLSRYVDAIVIRTFKHREVERLAEVADVPVINALTDSYHPCQALADMMTILEKKNRLAGVKLAYVGDGNNVANSLLLASGILGLRMIVASPPGYEPSPAVLRKAKSLVRHINQQIRVTNNPIEAVTDADVVYTDVWVSMGQEAERTKRKKDFKNYQINEELLSYAKRGAMVMHCLPAHRGEEINAVVLEGPQSVVFDQAENRLHTAKAILSSVIGE